MTNLLPHYTMGPEQGQRSFPYEIVNKDDQVGEGAIVSYYAASYGGYSRMFSALCKAYHALDHQRPAQVMPQEHWNTQWGE